MKPEVSELLFIESLFEQSKKNLGSTLSPLQDLERLTGDASTRRYYRLFTKDQSFVVCLDNPSEQEKNPFVSVQAFLNKHSIRVPKIYDMDLKKGYILEEDLGDVTLLQSLANLENKEHEYKIFENVIDSLLQMHRISDEDIKNSNIFNLKFDLDKYLDEVSFSAGYFLNKFLNIEDTSIKNKVITQFKPICERLANEKMILCHRDFHSRNIMVKGNENIIIDFQDARLGLAQYDLASMLDDCYYEVERCNKYKLIQHYYENLDVKIHGQESFDQFMSLYNDMILQRVFKAIGSFSYIYETRKDVRYVKYIGFAMEKLKKILLSDAKYGTLRKILFSYYYES